MIETQIEPAEINTTITIERESLAEVEKHIPFAVNQALTLAINDNDDYESSLTLIECYTEAKQTIVDYFKASKKSAYDTHRLISGMEKKMLEQYEEAEKLVAKKRAAYRELKAKEKAEADRAIAQALKEAEIAQAQEVAAVLAQQGEEEAATQVIERAIAAPAPIVFTPVLVPKQKGAAVRGKYTYEIVNPDEVQRNYCDPSDKKIKKVVEALGAKCGVNGIVVKWTESEAFSRK